jgi:hypothetical protein
MESASALQYSESTIVVVERLISSLNVLSIVEKLFFLRSILNTNFKNGGIMWLDALSTITKFSNSL